MRTYHHLYSTLLSLWNRKLVKLGLLVFLAFEMVVILKQDESMSLIFYRIASSCTRQNSTHLNTVTLNTKSALATPRTQKSGYLNLHLWSDTCARDLNILCNLPMFPRAPDSRQLVNKAVIADNLTDAEGIRLFGFISPDKSGFYLFIVQFCSAEVWLSHNESWRNARKVFDSENQPRELRFSDKTALVAGNKYFIEVVSTCFHRRNKIQLLWKTPSSSTFEIINGSYLSQYVDDTGRNQSLVYDDLLPDSLVCASRRNNRTYFKAQPEISYLSHDEVKDILPYCEYNPSYTVNYKMKRYEAVTRHVVHSFIYPFPEHMDLKDQKYWIYPLGVNEARKVVDVFAGSFHKRMPGWVRYIFSEMFVVRRRRIISRAVALLTPRISRGHFFLANFFRVTHDGLSERGTTRSLRRKLAASKLISSFSQPILKFPRHCISPRSRR